MQRIHLVKQSNSSEQGIAFIGRQLIKDSWDWQNTDQRTVLELDLVQTLNCAG